MSAWVAVKDALLTPLGAAHDDVERLPALRMIRVGDPNRTSGHLGCARCNL